MDLFIFSKVKADLAVLCELDVTIGIVLDFVLEWCDEGSVKSSQWFCVVSR